MKLACTLRILEDTLSAAAFAEENEHESARDFLRRSKSKEADKQPLCARSTVSSETRLAKLTSAV